MILIHKDWICTWRQVKIKDITMWFNSMCDPAKSSFSLGPSSSSLIPFSINSTTHSKPPVLGVLSLTNAVYNTTGWHTLLDCPLPNNFQLHSYLDPDFFFTVRIIFITMEWSLSSPCTWKHIVVLQIWGIWEQNWILWEKLKSEVTEIVSFAWLDYCLEFQPIIALTCQKFFVALFQAFLSLNYQDLILVLKLSMEILE